MFNQGQYIRLSAFKSKIAQQYFSNQIQNLPQFEILISFIYPNFSYNHSLPFSENN